MQVVSGIKTLCLLKLSESAQTKIRKIIRKEQIKEIVISVEDFNDEQR